MRPGPSMRRDVLPLIEMKVGKPGVVRAGRFSVVCVPAAAVLVRDVTPAEVRQRLGWQDSQSLHGADPLRTDRAQMGPVVTEVEYVHELLARPEPRQPDAPVVLADLALDLPVRVRKAEPDLVGEGELL